MIDREQVLHVARLARLELSGEETARISAELSKVLGHIEKLSALDLSAVAPTSHVVAVDVALRPDEPHVSLPQAIALAAAPDVADGGFRVPSPQA